MRWIGDQFETFFDPVDFVKFTDFLIFEKLAADLSGQVTLLIEIEH